MEEREEGGGEGEPKEEEGEEAEKESVRCSSLSNRLLVVSSPPPFQAPFQAPSLRRHLSYSPWAHPRP